MSVTATSIDSASRFWCHGRAIATSVIHVSLVGLKLVGLRWSEPNRPDMCEAGVRGSPEFVGTPASTSSSTPCLRRKDFLF